MRTFIQNLYRDADIVNTENVKFALKRSGPHKTLLDIGCWDGEQTMVWADACSAKQVHGLEVVASAAKQAKSRGILVQHAAADIGRLPYKNTYFDCIVSNQVVEHLTSLDKYFSECARILKPGGYLITSTNNLSSWHNIFAIIMGWAPFDLTNSSARSMGIGNPLAMHKGQSDQRGESWTHKCVYTARWLSAWQGVYGIKHIQTFGAGYYPFPARLGQLLPLHSAFITTLSQKI